MLKCNNKKTHTASATASKELPWNKKENNSFSSEKVRYNVFFKLEFAEEQRLAYRRVQKKPALYQTKPVYQRTTLPILRGEPCIAFYVPPHEAVIA